MKRIIFTFIIVGVSFHFLTAQHIPSETERNDMQKRLRCIVEHLVADSLEGRESGTRGEKIARDYIVSQFSEAGLAPYYPNGSFYKSFDFMSSEQYSPESRVIIGSTSYYYDTDFTVVSYFGKTSSRAKTIFVGNGLISPEHNIDDYSGFEVKDLKDKIFLIDISFSKKYDFICHINYYHIIQEIIYNAIQNGASMIVLFQSNEKGLQFHKHAYFQNSRKSVPVIFAEGNLRKRIMKSEGEDMVVQIYSNRNKLEGYNVAATINNNAARTIVIGAHYDHLGYGSPISRHVGAPAIHPGADDNASGVAVMIELARFLKQSGLKSHNFVFVAFGAEEKGLIGSKAFIEDTLCKLPDVIAMINLDMVGRLDKDVRKLNVLGTGSSEKWDSLLNITYNPQIDLGRNPSGTGGSDQMSFYMKNIPVLFFITGLHKDYHTPSDVIDKINFEGMTDITVFLMNLFMHIDNVKEMPFVEGEKKESLVDRSYTRGVTLGVIPDHAFAGKGMRIDDVFKGRNAEQAGLKAGDIIVGIDEHDVSDISTYMKALANFRPGLKANIKIIRNTEEHTFEVTF